MSEKPFNPFEHHHDHHHEDDDTTPLDPAQQSLADALRVSFAILKVVMLALVVLYFATGFFNVPAQQVAVRLRFGGIVGDAGEQVIQPGGPHWSWPYPIEEIVVLPGPDKPFNLAVTRSFWYEVDEGDVAKSADDLLREGKVGPLDPVLDGYLLTGDKDIIHTRWSVTYSVKRPLAFVRHVGVGKRGDPMSRAAQFVQVAAETAVVETVANIQADRIMRGDEAIADRAKQLINRSLAGGEPGEGKMDTGLEVTEFILKERAFPTAALKSYRLVTEAERRRQTILSRAQADRTNDTSPGIRGSCS